MKKKKDDKLKLKEKNEEIMTSYLVAKSKIKCFKINLSTKLFLILVVTLFDFS